VVGLSGEGWPGSSDDPKLFVHPLHLMVPALATFVLAAYCQPAPGSIPRPGAGPTLRGGFQRWPLESQREVSGFLMSP